MNLFVYVKDKLLHNKNSFYIMFIIYGMRWVVGEHSIVFYTYDGRIERYNSVWVKTTLTVSMLERVGLITNLGNTKEMVLNQGFI